MKISIVIPVYRVEAYIASCIESIIAQKYDGEIECILVNDCSPDRSAEIAQQTINAHMGQTDIQFRILHHKTNRGVSAARNSGIKAATGDYVWFIDSDDSITPNSLNSFAAPLTSQYWDFVVCDYTMIGGGEKYLQLRVSPGETLQPNIFRKFLTSEIPLYPPTKLVNLEFLRSNNLYFIEGITHEDLIWSFQLAHKAKSMYVVDKALYNYCIRESSITTSEDTRKNVDACMTVHRHLIDYSKEQKITNNPDVTRFIESDSRRILHLCYSGLSLKEYFNTYKTLRHHLTNGRIHIFSQLANSPLAIIRFLDYLMPCPIGWCYEFALRQLGKIRAL